MEFFSGPCFPVFGLNIRIKKETRIQENTDQKKLCIWTRFMQCKLAIIMKEKTRNQDKTSIRKDQKIARKCGKTSLQIKFLN